MKKEKKGKKKGEKGKKGGKRKKKREKINKGKNYDKIWYLLKGEKYIYFPPICTSPIFGGKYHFGKGGGKNIIFEENIYPWWNLEIPILYLRNSHNWSLKVRHLMAGFSLFMDYHKARNLKLFRNVYKKIGTSWYIVDLRTESDHPCQWVNHPCQWGILVTPLVGQ